MKRRTACAVLAAGIADRLFAQANPWDEETRLGLDAMEQGHPVQARQHFRSAYDLAKAAKTDELEVARCLENSALPLGMKEREKLYREALAIREKWLKPADPEIARSLAQVGSAMSSQGNANGARPLLDRALMIAEDNPMTVAAADVFILVGLFRNVYHDAPANPSGAQLTTQENLRQNVSPLYQRALEVRERNPGADDLALAEALELNGVVASQMDGGVAQPFFTRAAEIRKRHLQKLSPSVSLPPGPFPPQNSTQPSPDGAVRIGAGVSAPTLVHKVEPEYSELARKAKWQGEVGLVTVVTQTGDPVNIRLTRSLGLGLDEQAYFAVRNWKFRPGMKEGQPVNVRANIAVTFRLR